MASIRLAVKAMCVQCMGGPVPGHREQIRGCTDRASTLYQWRPYRWRGEYTPSQAAVRSRMAGFPASVVAPVDPNDSYGSEVGSDSDAAEAIVEPSTRGTNDDRMA